MIHILIKESYAKMIRIISGKYKSRKIEAPDNNLTKPSMDRVKEGIFSSISFIIKHSSVLDLFAGSGAYGIEAISRGASSATFVDSNTISVNTINKNIDLLQIDNCVVAKEDYMTFLQNSNESFDIIFIDPPYIFSDFKSIVEIILQKNILNESGCMIIENDKELDFSFFKFKKIKEYKYSKTYVYILYN